MRSVFVEEMLHFLLAANLLNAVGGRPRIDTPRMFCAHPRALPHADPAFEVSLLPFGAEALELFLKIEQPSAPDGGSGERLLQDHRTVLQRDRARNA